MWSTSPHPTTSLAAGEKGFADALASKSASRTRTHARRAYECKAPASAKRLSTRSRRAQSGSLPSLHEEHENHKMLQLLYIL